MFLILNLCFSFYRIEYQVICHLPDVMNEFFEQLHVAAASSFQDSDAHTEENRSTSYSGWSFCFEEIDAY